MGLADFSLTLSNGLLLKITQESADLYNKDGSLNCSTPIAKETLKDLSGRSRVLMTQQIVAEKAQALADSKKALLGP
jgi:hypothetical protein